MCVNKLLIIIGMKTKLFLLLSCLFTLVGCGKEDDVQPGTEPEVVEKSLSLVSQGEMSFGTDGATDSKIIYELLGVEDGTLPEVECDADWITNIRSAKSIVFFDVAPNNSANTRSTKIVLSYEELSCSVDISQSGLSAEVDVEHRAEVLNGEYCGPYAGCISSPNANYFAILSMNGTTGFSHLYIDQYYRFDFYADKEVESNEKASIPHGTYRLDKENLGSAWTFSHSYSTRLEPKVDGSYDENYFTDGIVVVSENSIDAILTLDNGEVHHVVYNGSLELEYIVVENNGPYSWLEDDYSFNHTGGIIRLLYYGDFTVGTNWVVQLLECQNPINGDYMSIDLYSSAKGFVADNIYGTYTAVTKDDPMQANTFIASSSCYSVVENDYIKPRAGAPLVDGTISIERDGLDVVVVFDCVDDIGNKITGTFRCVQLEMYDKTTGC